jgi:hypothetical protein
MFFCNENEDIFWIFFLKNDYSQESLALECFCVQPNTYSRTTGWEPLG